MNTTEQHAPDHTLCVHTCLCVMGRKERKSIANDLSTHLMTNVPQWGTLGTLTPSGEVRSSKDTNVTYLPETITAAHTR